MLEIVLRFEACSPPQQTGGKSLRTHHFEIQKIRPSRCNTALTSKSTCRTLLIKHTLRIKIVSSLVEAAQKTLRRSERLGQIDLIRFKPHLACLQSLESDQLIVRCKEYKISYVQDWSFLSNKAGSGTKDKKMRSVVNSWKTSWISKLKSFCISNYEKLSLKSWKAEASHLLHVYSIDSLSNSFVLAVQL